MDMQHILGLVSNMESDTYGTPISVISIDGKNITLELKAKHKPNIRYRFRAALAHAVQREGSDVESNSKAWEDYKEHLLSAFNKTIPLLHDAIDDLRISALADKINGEHIAIADLTVGIVSIIGLEWVIEIGDGKDNMCRCNFDFDQGNVWWQSDAEKHTWPLPVNRNNQLVSEPLVEKGEVEPATQPTYIYVREKNDSKL